ncbi:MAG: hypothetical protein IKK03_14540 [Lachnospiraceae bacterium]|nr:hypothetical protein [Lachnospiraceae bacterium]
MEYSIKGIIFIICVLAVTVYLIVAAIEDAKTMEVTRGKHLIGLIPAIVVWLLCTSERNIYDIGIIWLFVVLWMICGWIGVYGMADGFVYSNLTLFWGGIGGVAGVGVVILNMVLAGFSGMVEVLVRKLATLRNFKENRKIAFVPHILMGYMIVVIVAVQI